MTTKEEKRRKREAKRAAGEISPVFTCPICPNVSYTRIQRLRAHTAKHIQIMVESNDDLTQLADLERPYQRPQKKRSLCQECSSCAIGHISGLMMIQCNCRAEQEAEEFEEWRQEKLESIRFARARLTAIDELKAKFKKTE